VLDRYRLGPAFGYGGVRRPCGARLERCRKGRSH